MGFQSPLPTFVNSFIDYANLSSPLNSILATLLAFALLSLFPVTPSAPQPWELPPAPGKLYNWRPAKHDRPQKWEQFTPTQLAIFDGNQEGGKVLIAVRRKVYDVTQGKSFYGPGQSSSSSALAFLSGNSQTTCTRGRASYTRVRPPQVLTERSWRVR